MFHTSWIINHPIDEESALFERTAEEIQKMDVEVFVTLKGFDDVFSQTIYAANLTSLTNLFLALSLSARFI